MQLKETKSGCQYFVFEHSHSYQKVQFQFYDAVESLNPQNIGVSQLFYAALKNGIYVLSPMVSVIAGFSVF